MLHSLGYYVNSLIGFNGMLYLSSGRFFVLMYVPFRKTILFSVKSDDEN